MSDFSVRKRGWQRRWRGNTRSGRQGIFILKVSISVLILNILAISKAISGMLLWTQNKRKMSTLVIGQL